MPVNAGTVYINVVPNTAAFATQLKSQITPAAAAAGASVSRSFAKAGSGLTSLGRSLTRNVSLPLVGIGAVATKMAYDYDKAFTQIAATTNQSAETIEKWRGQVLELSGETAQAPKELADALYFLASAGLKTSQVMDVLEVSAKASAAGLGETQEVARLTANVLNAYPKAGLEAADAVDTLVAAVKVGTAAPDEFANAMGRILPIASKAGVGFDQIAASLASVSNIGLDVNEGVTAMRGVLQALVAPGTQAADTLKSIGISTDELRASLAEDGLIATLDLLEDASKGQIDVLQDIIPNVRALTGFFGLQGQEARKVDAAFRQVANSTGELNKAFKTTAESDAFKFDKALNDLRVAGVKLGNEIIPILVDTVIPAVQDAVKWFSDLSPEAKRLGVQIAGLAIVAGPLLRVAGALTTVTGALVKFGGAVAKVGAIGKLAGPVGLAAIALHDLAAASKALQEDGVIGAIAEELTGWGADLLRSINPVAAEVVDALGTIATAFRDVDTTVQQGKRGFDIKGLSQTMATMRKFGVSLTVAEQELFDAYVAAGQFGSALQLLQRIAARATKGLKNMQTQEEQAAEAAADADQQHRGMARSVQASGNEANTASGKFNDLSNKVRSVPPTAKTTVSAPGLDAAIAGFGVLRGVIGAIDTSITIAVNAIGNAASAVSGGGEHGAYIPGAASGGFVRRHQVIRVGEKSKPEMILPLKDPAGAAALQKAMEGALRAVLANGGQSSGASEIRITNWGAGRKAIHADLVWSNSMRGW